MSSIHAALEIGTTRTVLAIAEAAGGGRLSITSRAEIPSSGIRKSQILNIPDATQSIRSVLREVEKRQEATGSKVTIGNAVLAISGQHIMATRTDGQAIVESGRVGDAEIHEAVRRAREMPIPKGRELLDVVDQDYVLDRLGGITAPKGMSGKMLRLNALQIHADANRIQDARSAAEGAHLEIRDTVFATTCAADAVLEEHERRNGSLVLDLGGGSTGYAVYCDGFLLAAGVIGVGGDHVTNDIAHAFQTTNAQAEQLKTEESSAIPVRRTGEGERVRITGSSSLMESRTISRLSLDTVVNARLKELFAIIRERLEDQDLVHRLHAGAVLTGGGAGMKDIQRLAEQELGMSVRIGRPIHMDGLDGEKAPWAFAAISGALMYAHANYEDRSILDDIFGRFFK